jgi:hypothetical protein
MPVRGFSLLPSSVSSISRRFLHLIIATTVSLLLLFIASISIDRNPFQFVFIHEAYRRRPECSCSRSSLPPLASEWTPDLNNNSRSFLCSPYATRRGPNQRIIAISLFGPKENKMFQLNRSLTFLDELIADLNVHYADGFTLRIYHDDTINVTNIICPIECQHSNVDFCNVTDKLYMPPKIWRFIPAGDPLVDISK